MDMLDFDRANTVAATCASSIANSMLRHQWNSDDFALNSENKITGPSKVYFSYHQAFLDFLLGDSDKASFNNRVNALNMTVTLLESYFTATDVVGRESQKFASALKHLVRVDHFTEHARELSLELEKSCLEYDQKNISNQRFDGQKFKKSP